MNIDIPKTPGYSMLFFASNQSPTDGGTLFFGGNGVTAAGTGFGGPIPKAGTLKAASLRVIVAGTLGTSENTTIVLRLNNTTDITISSTVQHTAASQSTINSAALSTALAVGDYLEGKATYPTFVTNPTAVYYIVTAYIET